MKKPKTYTEHEYQTARNEAYLEGQRDGKEALREQLKRLLRSEKKSKRKIR